MREGFLRSGVILIFICIFCAASGVTQGTAEQVLFQTYAKPVPVPEFSLENLQGKMVDIRDYRGQVLLLNFRSIWCPICRKEDPSLEKLFTQYSPKGLVLFFIIPYESEKSIEKFMKKESLHLPVLLDKRGKVSRLLGVWAHPTSYLIDRHGMVRYRVMGALDWTSPEATSVIDHLLKER
jgi:peroxiredoxin